MSQSECLISWMLFLPVFDPACSFYWQRWVTADCSTIPVSLNWHSEKYLYPSYWSPDHPLYDNFLWIWPISSEWIIRIVVLHKTSLKFFCSLSQVFLQSLPKLPFSIQSILMWRWYVQGEVHCKFTFTNFCV